MLRVWVLLSCIASIALCNARVVEVEKDGSENVDANALTPADLSDDWDRPYYCRGLDCPPFKVLETKGDLQLRRYAPSTFVATRVKETTFLQAQLLGIKRLFAYYAGYNNYGVSLRPTVPLVTALHVRNRATRTVDGSYWLLAYLPDDRQKDPPKPRDPDVKILKLRAREFFVQSFEGFVDEEGIIDKGLDLIARLHNQGRRISRCVFGFAVYDPPTTVLFRHNEVWVPHKRRRCTDPDDCPHAQGEPGDADDDDFDDSTWPEAGDEEWEACPEDEDELEQLDVAGPSDSMSTV